MRDLKLRRNERGISLIALVITIIVIIILATIAFNSSTSTIGKANYSKFVSNVSEVEQAINEKMIEVKGAMLAKGSQITDGQVFNYVAKGGKTDEDFVVESRTPDYTIIEKNANIGIKLPVMRVNTPTETNVEVKYAVTKNGKVFIWPPFPSENAYNIRDKEFVDSSLVSSSGDVDITVAGTTFKLQIDGNSKIENRELLDDGLSKKEFEEITSKIKVGDYVNYVPTAVQNVETDPTKTGYTKEILSTDTTTKWRILSIDDETGKVMITTEGPVNKVTLKGATGYLYGSNELHELCEKLYSNDTKKLVARSMTIEDLRKINLELVSVTNKKIAYYLSDTSADDLKNIVVDGKTYGAYRHEDYYENGFEEPRFWAWNENNITITASNENNVKKLTRNTAPILVDGIGLKTSLDNIDEKVEEIIGNDDGFLASKISEISCMKHVHYALPIVASGKIKIGHLINSRGTVSGQSAGIRPIILFSAKLLKVENIDNSDSPSQMTWNIK